MAGQPSASAGKRTASPRDWTQGSIVRSLWSLSWPAIITQILFVLGVVIDIVFVARLGAAPTAGVGIAGVVVTVVVAGIMGLGTGVRAMVARFVGAGDIEKAQHAAQQALLVSAIYGGVFAVIGFFLARPIMGLFGAQPEVVTQGANYLRIWATRVDTAVPVYDELQHHASVRRHGKPNEDHCLDSGRCTPCLILC